MGKNNSTTVAGIVALVVNLLLDALVVVIIYVVKKKSTKWKWDGLERWQKNGLALVLVLVTGVGWVPCYIVLNQGPTSPAPLISPRTEAPTIHNPNNVSL